jgi:hypothetical protein
LSVTVTDPISDGYVPNGATTDFPFDFKIATADEIAVWQVLNGVASLIGPSDYSVSISASGEGGTVTMNVAPATGTGTIYLVSDPSFEQATAFTASGAFSPKTLNDPFDRAAIRDAILRQLADSAIRAPVFETLAPLPAAASRLNKYLLFDNGGQPSLGDGGGAKGDPGGNAMAIGLFSAASALSIPVGTDTVRTSGYSVLGVGIGDYVSDAAVNSAYVAAHAFRATAAASVSSPRRLSASRCSARSRMARPITLPPSRLRLRRAASSTFPMATIGSRPTRERSSATTRTGSGSSAARTQS